jgi:NOL1/NOP2/fmu family ribosome biogenesis protein
MRNEKGEMRNEKGEMRNDRQQTKGKGETLTILSAISHQPSAIQVELPYQEAMKFLRGETLTFSPDTPRGIVEVCFEGHPLGQIKNIGTRANNLYPKPWRIKTTHIPTEYEPILKKI